MFTQGFFKFSSNQSTLFSENLFVLEDGVIPSSNSVMANNLFLLSHYTGNRDYLLRVVATDLKNYEIFMREELTKVKGIASIETNFALGRVKTKNNLPLNSV